MPRRSATEALLRRDRLIATVGLLVVCLLCWCYVLAGAGTGMSVRAMSSWQFPPPVQVGSAGGTWESVYWLTMTLMWWAMMIAMMLPSAAPTVLLYASVYRHAQAKGQLDGASLPLAVFVAGYLIAWLAFSIAAAVLQWSLEQAGLMHAMMMWSSDTLLTGALLIAAGLYQLSPQKHTCLKHCRSPVEFLTTHWRAGRLGAFRMGLEHGMYCVACCWLLMTLLFAGGVMNIVWIAGLSVYVLIEKLVPFGMTIARMSGWLILVTGTYVIVVQAL